MKAYKKDIGLQCGATPKQEYKIKENSSAETSGTSSSRNDNWTAYQTPEGYWYYHNNMTGESRWDPPEGFPFSSEKNQKTLGNSEQSSSEQSNEAVKSDQVCDQNKEGNNEHNSPYGKWETVDRCERNDDLRAKQEVPEKGEDLQAPAVKFKEKQLPVRNRNNLNETNITFKKRKSSHEKKRSIRQRTDDS